MPHPQHSRPGCQFREGPWHHRTSAQRASTGAIKPQWRTVPDKCEPDHLRTTCTLCCLNLGAPRELTATRRSRSVQPCRIERVCGNRRGRVFRHPSNRLMPQKWAVRQFCASSDPDSVCEGARRHFGAVQARVEKAEERRFSRLRRSMWMAGGGGP